jgi:bis(5'-nucleosyl)-tetraphosphatase (symmetrical)
LRKQRMLHVAEGHVLVHAGLLPSWTVAQARDLATEVEAELRGKDYDKFFTHMYGNQPDAWDDELDGYKRLRVITNALTRMRICTPQGAMEFKFKGEQHKIPAGYIPWFDVPHRASSGTPVIFGHWSALGLLRRGDIIALDTGCLWGGPLTAIRLEDQQVFQVPSANPIKAPHN